MALKREIKEGISLSLMWTFPAGMERTSNKSMYSPSPVAFTSVLQHTETPGDFKVIRTVPANVHVPKAVTPEGIDNICRQLLDWPLATMVDATAIHPTGMYGVSVAPEEQYCD